MGRLVEFPLQGGGTVLVEAPDAAPIREVTRGLRSDGVSARVTETAQHTFEEAIDRVQPAAESLIRRLRSQDITPDEIHVEFGLDFHAEAGAFIAAASTTANFKITLTWRHDSTRPAGLSAPPETPQERPR